MSLSACATASLTEHARRLIQSLSHRNIVPLSCEDVKRILQRGLWRRFHARNCATVNSLRGMRTTLSRILGWAVECGWLRDNPCSDVKIPRGTPGRIRPVLSPTGVATLAAELGEPHRTLVLFLALTGLRISEAVGLRWSDISDGILRVRRRVYEGKIDDVKTPASARGLPLPAAAMLLLDGLRSGEGDGWIFRTRVGTPLIPRNALRRYVHPAARLLGIPLCGWHDFRHALATWLCGLGWSAKLAAAICGHADVRTTLQIYTHPGEAEAREALEQISGLLLQDVAQSSGAAQLAADNSGFGEPRRTRTSNPLIKSQLLYRLS